MGLVTIAQLLQILGLEELARMGSVGRVLGHVLQTNVVHLPDIVEQQKV
jgi:hypothetical protein